MGYFGEELWVVHDQQIESRVADIAGSVGEDVGKEETGDMRFGLFVNSGDWWRIYLIWVERISRMSAKHFSLLCLSSRYL